MSSIEGRRVFEATAKVQALNSTACNALDLEGENIFQALFPPCAPHTGPIQPSVESPLTPPLRNGYSPDATTPCDKVADAIEPESCAGRLFFELMAFKAAPQDRVRES